jgi:hypothetical protein
MSSDRINNEFTEIMLDSSKVRKIYNGFPRQFTFSVHGTEDFLSSFHRKFIETMWKNNSRIALVVQYRTFDGM